MREFRGKLAVITGGGSGIGRALGLALAKEGAHVALCDVFSDLLSEAKAACEAVATQGARITAHVCDVSNEAQVLELRAAVEREHATDHIQLLFNNAGIGGGGSFVLDERAHWDRTFNVCWFGVYYCSRAFLPLLMRSTEACIVNTSSINGVFAVEPMGPHTAYSTAKFAVKGFSEALKIDLRLNAPHVSVVLVMPGHIGTSIVANTMRSQGMKPVNAMTAADVDDVRHRLTQLKVPHAELSDDQIKHLVQKSVDDFRDNAPVSAAQAAGVILDGIREGRWRILIGEDAKLIDKFARENAEDLYEPATLQRLRGELTPPR